jgi:hypothetical protein
MFPFLEGLRWDERVETLFLLIDSIAMLLVVIYSLRNDRLPPGAPEQGLFRMTDPAAAPAPKPPARRVRRRPL